MSTIFVLRGTTVRRRLTLAALLLALPAAAHADGLSAGAASVEITPPVGMPLWGYAARHDAASVGVRDPLYARCVVLGDGRQRVAVVSLDLGRPPTREQTAAIRRRLRPLSID